MDRYRILRNIASGWIVISVLCLILCGCGEQAPEPPPKPREVRKKIVARPGPPKTEPSVAADPSTGDKPQEEKSEAAEPGKTAPDSGKPALAQVSTPDGKDTKATSQAQDAKPVPAQTGAAEDKDAKPASKPEEPVPAAADKTDVEGRAGEVEKADTAVPPDIAEEGEEDEILSAISGMDPEDADKFTASYDPKGRVDPFEPLLREKRKEPEKEQPQPPASAVASSRPKPPPRRLTPLEKLDLGQLKLVGIIRAESGNKALVEEASGKGYIIVKGTYIGIHSGIVVDILPDRVVVEEQDEDVLGKVTVRKRELKFNRPEGEDYYEM
ncbi:MAG: pilus assembly protein PilP [Desulfobacterales bacterium]